MHFRDLIDVDHPGTWPLEVRKRAELWANELRGTTGYTGDLNLDKEDEDAFRSLLVDRLLVAYHATRLLDHEVEGITKQGLRLASQQLVHDRVAAAFASGDLTIELRDLLSTANVFHEKDPHNRVDQVCLILSRRTFDHSSHGADPLMSEWGGELITMSGGGAALRPSLRELGKPTIVVAAIDLSESWKRHATYPSLHKVFVGRLLDLGDLGADVFYRKPVLPEQIIDIWQPGHPEYERHKDLPRS